MPKSEETKAAEAKMAESVVVHNLMDAVIEWHSNPDREKTTKASLMASLEMIEAAINTGFAVKIYKPPSGCGLRIEVDFSRTNGARSV